MDLRYENYCVYKKIPHNFCVRKQLWGSELWSDGGYIRTVGDGTTSMLSKAMFDIRQCVDFSVKSQILRGFRNENTAS